LKPEWWGSPLAQEKKYQGRNKPVTRDDDDNNNSHIPKLATEHEDITVLWNQGIQTDREFLANRPDIQHSTVLTRD
jgi:hypothetical protein